MSGNNSNTPKINWLTDTPQEIMAKMGISPNSVGGSSVDVAGEEKNDWIEKGHLALDVEGAYAGTGEFSRVMGGQWKGVNSKWYDLKWGGNQYAGGRNAVLETAERFHFAGKVGFWADTSLNVAEEIQEYKEGDYSAMVKTGVDIAVGYVGTKNPLGFLIWGVYTVNSMYINWVNNMNEWYEKTTGESAWSQIEKGPN